MHARPDPVCDLPSVHAQCHPCKHGPCTVQHTLHVCPTRLPTGPTWPYRALQKWALHSATSAQWSPLPFLLINRAPPLCKPYFWPPNKAPDRDNFGPTGCPTGNYWCALGFGKSPFNLLYRKVVPYRATYRVGVDHESMRSCRPLMWAHTNPINGYFLWAVRMLIMYPCAKFYTFPMLDFGPRGKSVLGSGLADQTGGVPGRACPTGSHLFGSIKSIPSPISTYDLLLESYWDFPSIRHLPAPQFLR